MFSPTKSTISQIFETKWLYETDFVRNKINKTSDYEQYLLSSSYVNSLKSGVLGYIDGKPLISGYKSDITSNDIVNITYNQRISSYKALNSKLCGTNSILERKLVKFNENTSYSCNIQLTQSDLTTLDNCNKLRKIIFKKINDYFVPSNLVSKNGNPNMTVHNQSDWLKVYPDSRFLNVNDSSFDPNQCVNMPYKLNIYFFYLPVGESNNQIISEILGTYIT